MPSEPLEIACPDTRWLIDSDANVHCIQDHLRLLSPRQSIYDEFLTPNTKNDENPQKNVMQQLLKAAGPPKILELR